MAISKSFLRNLRQSRYVPLWSRLRRFQPIAQELLGKLRAKRCAKLVSADGVEISEGAYATIHKHLSGHMAESLRTLDCMIRYLGRNPIDLEVMISNVGGINGLVDCVAKARGIPSYLIINGYLSGDFLDEAKYATVINAYAPSIKENYFRGMGNVICLGDPRMDAYPPRERPRTFDKESFTVTIGASGFNNIDLNSYVAVEFEFMFDVLQALSMVKKSGVDVRVVIKVRPNGYASQYRQFSNEYFPDIVDEILDAIPMKDVLERSDLYISIYSQTVFEASCLGVRCIYYKKDDEIVNPPFDRRSELVTVGSVDDLVEALSDFRSGHSRFDAFLQRSVMEKYIGPLDGGNVERNLNFIYEMLDKSVAKRVG